MVVPVSITTNWIFSIEKVSVIGSSFLVFGGLFYYLKCRRYDNDTILYEH
jgi:hypothetical protein